MVLFYFPVFSVSFDDIAHCNYSTRVLCLKLVSDINPAQSNCLIADGWLLLWDWFEPIWPEGATMACTTL